MAYNFNEMTNEEIKTLLSDPDKLSELNSEELLSLKSFVKDDLSMQADLDKRINNLKTPQQKNEETLDAILNDNSYTEEKKELALNAAVEYEQEILNSQNKEPQKKEQTETVENIQDTPDKTAIPENTGKEKEAEESGTPEPEPQTTKEEKAAALVEESDEFVFSQQDMENEEKILKEAEDMPEETEAAETFDEENNLDSLSAEQLAENQQTVDRFADFNPFELDDKGKLVHPEFADEYKAYQNLQVTDDQGNEIADKQKAEKIKGLLVETAKLETDLQAQTSPKFMTPEEYIAKLKDNLQKGIIVSAYASEMQNRPLSEISRKEIADKFNDVLGKLDEQPLKAGAKSIFAYVGVVNDRMTAVKDRLKAKFKDLPVVQKTEEKLRQFDKDAEKVVGPKSWARIKRLSKVAGKRLKNIAVYGAVGYATGGVGLAILAAKSGYDMYTGMTQKAAAENISLKEYAKKNPWETTLAASQTVLSAAGAVVGLGALGEHAAQAVSPVLKTAGRVLAVGPKLVKTAVKLGKLQLIKRGVIKGDADKTKQELKEAFDQTVDAAFGIFVGETVHDVTHGDTNTAETQAQSEKEDQKPDYEAERQKIGADEEQITSPAQENAQNSQTSEHTAEPAKEEPLSADQTFWDNRADKFLGEENTQNLYARIDSGEIKLPEGIETKQEFAYKLAMAFEQAPRLASEDMGIAFRHTSELEAGIANMTPEQFEKLGSLMNDFSDRGNYIGERQLYQPPVKEEQRQGSGEEKEKETAPAENKQEEEKQTEPEPQKVGEVRDEEYYKDMQGLKELKDYLNEARKSPDYTVEQTLNAYLALQTQNGQLTEQQAQELNNYMRQELGLNDKQNGDDDISKRDISRAIKETEKTTEAMEQNAEEVLIAKNLTYPPREDLPEQLPESYSHNTESSQFYKGLSSFMKDMREQTGDGVKPQDVMKAAILEGRISEEQATVVNTRCAELRAEGKDFDRAFKIMEKDFGRHADYFQAQENARETEPQERQKTEPAAENTTRKGQTLTSEIKHEQENAQGQAPVMSQAELAKYLADQVKDGVITEDQAKVFAKNYVEKHGSEMRAADAAAHSPTNTADKSVTVSQMNKTKGGR